MIIAVPLHLHHPVAIAAMRKGKHVLTEKLMAHDIGLCKEMARVAYDPSVKDAKGNPIVLAVGHQRHYSILYDNAVEQISQGLIGDIHHIRAQWHRANRPGNDSWQPLLPAGDDKKKLESELKSWRSILTGTHKVVARPDSPDAIAEWNAKIAQKEHQINDITEELAQKYGYQVKELSDLKPKPRTRSALEELICWRLWQRTGGGLMAELGSHQLDAASIFIAAQYPDRPSRPPACRSTASAAATSSPPTATATITSTACSSSRASDTTMPTIARRLPTQTRKSSSRTRRSTATAMAATAKSSSAPTAR